MQDPESYSELGQKSVPSTKNKLFYDEEIASYKNTNPFRNSIFVSEIFNMCAIGVDGSKISD